MRAWQEGERDGERRFPRLGTPLGPHLTLALVLTVVLGGLFAVTVDNVASREGLVGIDAPAARFVLGHRSPSLTHAAKLVTLLGSAAFTVGLALLAALALVLLAKAVRPAAFLAVAVGLGDLSYVAMKLLVHRPRPAGALVALSTWSFPSGHAVGAVTLFGGLAWIFSRRSRSWAARAGAWAGAAILVALVDATRVYLGVHYASDVVGGDVLGAAWIAASATAWAAWDRLRGRQHRAEGKHPPV